MTDNRASVPVATHLGMVSRLLTDRVNADVIFRAAAEHAVAITTGSCAAIVLASDRERRIPADAVVVAVHAVARQDVPHSVFSGPAAAGILHDAVIVVDDTANPPARWANIAAVAAEHAVAGLRAFPVRQRGSTVGALVIGTDTAWLHDGVTPPGHPRRDTMAAQVLADFVGAALALDTDASRRTNWSESLGNDAAQLANREIAIGILAQRHSLDIEAATDLLHSMAIRSGVGHADIARQVLAGEIVA